jgi:isopropylmalate/homocitrate/citramalate synthase
MAKERSSCITDKYWVTDFNFLDEVRQQFTLPDNVYIHDVTLREAEQAPHVVLRPEEKLRILKALDDMGIHRTEILPIISDGDHEVAKEMVKMPRKNTKVFFLCRWYEKEVDFALESKADGIVIECPGFPWIGKVVWGLDENGIRERLVRVATYAKKQGIYTVTMPWDDFRAPLPFLEMLYKGAVYDAGVDGVVIADTFGMGLPWTTAYIVRKLKEWVPGTPVEWHAHNDYGLATSVMLSAVVGGASVVHTSFNALGERAGNAATEEVVLALELLLGVDTGIKLDHLYPTCKLIAELAKMPLPLNKAVVGDNEFTLESGMPAQMTDLAHKAGRGYATQAFSPELIGREGYHVICGKMTGASVITNKLKEWQLSATKEQISEIVEAIKREATIRKWSVPDDDCKKIAKEIIQRKS